MMSGLDPEAAKEEAERKVRESRRQIYPLSTFMLFLAGLLGVHLLVLWAFRTVGVDTTMRAISACFTQHLFV